MAITLCNASGLVYKAYARSFQAGASPVIYVFASGAMMNSVSRIFFVRRNGLAWDLMQDVPNIIDNLLTYYQAAATTSQPVLSPGSTIQVTDAFGTHQITLEAWDGTVVDDGTPAGAEHVEGATGTTRLARGNALSYKAFSRPYGNGGSTVVFLYATCSYPTGGWSIFFTSDGAKGWSLLETVPGLVNMLVTYYVGDYTSAFGLLDIAGSVVITDGYGTHTVALENWASDTDATIIQPPQQPRLTI